MRAGLATAAALARLAMSAFGTLGACAPVATTSVTPTPPAPPASASAAPMTAMGARVTLVDAGSKPRRALRFEFAPGRRETARLSIEQTASIDARAAIAQPRVDVSLALETEKLTPDGDVMGRCRVLGVELTTAPQTLDPAPLRASLASLDGASAPLVFTAHGELAVTGLLSEGDAGPSAAGMIVFDVLRDLDAPLPLERVGVGARWEVTPEHGERGAFRIESLDESSAVLRVERDVADGSVVVPPPNGTNAAPLTIASHTTKELTLTLRFDRLVRAARLVVRTTSTVSGAHVVTQAARAARVVTITATP